MQGRLIAIVVFTVGLLGSARAEQGPSVAVLEFGAKAGLSQDVADALADLVASAVVQVGGYRVIGKADIQSMLGFDKIKASLGCEQTSCLAEIGGALGVTYILVGNITRLGTVYLINMRLIDPAKSSVANRVSRKIEGKEEALVDAVPQVVAALFNASSDGTTAIKLQPGMATPGLGGAAPRDLLEAEKLLERDLGVSYNFYLKSADRRKGMSYLEYLHMRAVGQRKGGKILCIVLPVGLAMLVGGSLMAARDETSSGPAAFGIVMATIGGIGALAGIGGPFGWVRGDKLVKKLAPHLPQKPPASRKQTGSSTFRLAPFVSAGLGSRKGSYAGVSLQSIW